MRRPRSTLSDKVYGNSKEFGIPATSDIINHQLELIAKFVNDSYHTIFFVDMLEELIKYSIENKRKFDIVASLGMAELGDEELSGYIVKREEDKTND